MLNGTFPDEDSKFYDPNSLFRRCSEIQDLNPYTFTFSTTPTPEQWTPMPTDQAIQLATPVSLEPAAGRGVGGSREDSSSRSWTPAAAVESIAGIVRRCVAYSPQPSHIFRRNHMHTFLMDMLECPACHDQLSWHIEQQVDGHIEHGEAHCSGCTAVCPIRDGIGIFLTPDLPRNDLWDQVESQLTSYLRDHPELERQLMDVPIEVLSPTDQLFRALVLEERGSFDDARKAENLSKINLYTSEYLTCWNSQVEFMLENLAGFDEPVVDIASGRCYLVEKIAGLLQRPVVASDFSPNVLRRDRNLFQFLGLDDLVSLLAFDARRTPFRNNTVKIMTTNLGLPNIEDPGRLLHELHRVVDGTLLAISHFFPAEDELNREVIKDAGLDALLYRESALKHFVSAGWKVDFENSCMSEALPTPPSKILEGARADGLPAAPTELEWCVIRAIRRDLS